jgi:hypothetical protein
MTATEAQARINNVNVMVGGMLQSMYGQEESYFEEVLRRFMMKNPTDPDIIKFQKEMAVAGINSQMLNPDAWEVNIERVIGAGDQTIAQQKVTAMLLQSQRFDPTSQRKILHQWTSTMMDNPDLATDLVPMKKPEATDGTLEAEDVFGTLMEGIPISMREGIDQQGYIEAMIGMMAGKVGKLEEMEQAGETAELEELTGLDTVQQDIEQHIALFAQNPENGQLVKQYEDMLGQLNNMVKKFIQHYMEEKQAEAEEGGVDQEAMAKASATTMLAQVKANIGQQNAALKRQQSQAKFEQKMQQDMAKNQMKMQQDMQSHMLEMRKQMEQMRADLITGAVKTRAEIASTTAKAEAAPKETEK